MKRVFVMRHGKQESINDGTIWRREAPLSRAGTEAIQAAIRQHLDGVSVARVASSPLRRAQDSALCAVPSVACETSEALGPTNEAEWEEIYPRAIKEGKADTLAKFFEVASELLLEHGHRAFQFICSVADELEEGEVAFLVTHNPIAEMAVAVGFKQEVPSLDLKNADIVVINFVDGVPSNFEYLPVQL